MKLHDLLSCLRTCNVSIYLTSTSSLLAFASIYFYDSGYNIDFSDIHMDTTKLLDLSVNAIYVKGPGYLNIFVS